MPAFEGLKNKLAGIQRAKDEGIAVGVDDVFEAVSKLILDINELTGITAISAYPINHQEVFVEHLLKIMNIARVAYDTNSAGITEMSERQRQNHAAVMNSVAQYEQNLEEVQTQLTAIQNAWTAVSQNPELANVMDQSEAFRDIREDISNFSNLQKWFQDTQDEIQKRINTYEQAYRTLLNIVSPDHV